MALSNLTIPKDSDCLEALRVMDATRMGFAIVVDHGMQVMGTLTDGDVRRAAIASGGDLSSISASDACTREFAKAGATDGLNRFIELFADSRIQFLPIVNDDDVLEDVITRRQMQSIVLRCEDLPELGSMHLIDEEVSDFEIHRRPWGVYKTTVLQDRYQSKVIHVNPGARLSLQYHMRREEHWTVAGGEGVAQIGESLVPMRPGDTLFIPKGCKHRMENTSDAEFLIVSEVQIGDYFGEDDIIRVEDDYVRLEGDHDVDRENESDTGRASRRGEPIKLFLTDCDGCLTDAGMYYGEGGDELKKFNTRDGMAFAMLRERGVKCGIVTSEDRELIARRAKKLKLDYLVMGCANKLDAAGSICKREGIHLREVAYVGDDLNDVGLLGSVGCSFAPADACDAAKRTAGLVTNASGGGGVIREAVETLIRESRI